MTQLQFTWTVGKVSSGKLLREYLLGEKFISRQALTDIKFAGGALFVNGEHVTVRYPLKEGDRVTVCFPDEVVSESMDPVHIPLSILYEDEHFLAVDKPPDMPTIPSKFRNTDSLAQAVLFYYRQKRIPSTIHAVNRLDRNTSGIVLFAKHRYGHSLLSRLQKRGELERTYIALCHGVPEKTKGTIDLPIGRKEGSIIERCVCKDGQHAKTHFAVLKSFKEYAMVRLKLDTGRTHQIRVHMSSIGHPLLGDDLYGGDGIFIKRQALHSQSLQFAHPFLEKLIEVEAPVPHDMEKLMK
ncbi:RluA family pseudouridine synthase [Pseudalkalibacillus salsuginis]|uniref:RluA family pseudouridine synthase n=1 Tax=Pseudalkalibacillus salsuginis TaxID=2910972 RepID=UPI001F48381E|nr:RluA family pseudouridine synthase [Pseudalkalibacillus salsuginis]MCF6409180.1 RluA family pseudouridine synthase [Pseudalkalibacillus salsuginis]